MCDFELKKYKYDDKNNYDRSIYFDKCITNAIIFLIIGSILNQRFINNDKEINIFDNNNKINITIASKSILYFIIKLINMNEYFEHIIEFDKDIKLLDDIYERKLLIKDINMVNEFKNYSNIKYEKIKKLIYGLIIAIFYCRKKNNINKKFNDIIGDNETLHHYITILFICLEKPPNLKKEIDEHIKNNKYFDEINDNYKKINQKERYLKNEEKNILLFAIKIFLYDQDNFKNGLNESIKLGNYISLIYCSIAGLYYNIDNHKDMFKDLNINISDEYLKFIKCLARLLNRASHDL